MRLKHVAWGHGGTGLGPEEDFNHFTIYAGDEHMTCESRAQPMHAASWYSPQAALKVLARHH